MTIFDSIKYPISDTIKVSEITQLPLGIIQRIEDQLAISDIDIGVELAEFIRKIIKEYDEPL